MYEVEVKVEAAHDPVRERLAALGAESLGSVHQLDTYYDHPVRSFADSDEALRLRRESTPVDVAVDDSPTNLPTDHVTVDGETTDDVTTGAQPAEEPSVATTLTYKGPLVDDVSKTREEVETGLDDSAAADAILRALGFEPAAEVEKERERFACDGYDVALDSVRGLGEFVEIEAAAADEDEVEAARTGAFDLCSRLGLDQDRSTRASYLALLLDATG